MKGRELADEERKKRILRLINNRPDYMERYYYSLVTCTEKTALNYIECICHFLDFVEKNLTISLKTGNDFADLKASDVTYFVQKKCRSVESKKMYIYAIKSLFRFLEGDGYIEKNPMNSIKAPSPKDSKEVVIVDKEEIDIMFYNIDHPGGKDFVKKRIKSLKECYKCLLALALTTGARAQSLLEINIEDIDHKNRIIKIYQKGNKPHKAKYGDWVDGYLTKWLIKRERILESTGSNDPALFIDQKGTRLTYQQFLALLHKCTYNIEKNITPHTLRRTCCTEIIKKTGDITIASHVLGHRSITTTMKYVQLNESDDDIAIGVLEENYGKI